MVKIFHLVVLLSFIQANTFSQSKNAAGIIVGVVMDAETQNPIAECTIKLKTVSGTGFSKTFVSDNKGNFAVENIPFGLYQLSFSVIAYSTVTIDSLNIRAERFDFNVGDVKLKKTTTDLGEVIVYAEKPLIENKDGKIVYNVGESALSAGSSTAEILKNMPLVSNDPTGKILLKGKEPKILIDDKPVDLNAQQLADLLESLPGGAVEKIELLLNPPAQYASEPGGVINIITRKGKIGWVGKVTASAGSRGEGNLAANLSYRNKKVNINISAGAGASILKGGSNSSRTNLYADSVNYFNTIGTFTSKSLRPNVRLQVDYDAKKNRQWGLVLQLNTNHFDNLSSTQYSNINQFNTLYRLSQRSNNSFGDNLSASLQPSFTYKGKKPGETLRIIGAYAYGDNENNRHFFQQFLNTNFTPSGIDSTQQQRVNNSSQNASLRVNYDLPLAKKGWVFTTGFSFNSNMNHNILYTFFLKKPEQVFIANNLLNSDFNFAQNIYSIRAGLTAKLNAQLQVIGNIQLEKTNFIFDFKSGFDDSKNEYFNFLPALTIRKEFNPQSSVSLVYRKSIRRPGIGELNPAIDYNDPYNLRFGNPGLAPSVAHNFDFNFSIGKGKSYINSSVGFNLVEDIFNTIRTLQPDGKTFVTWQNIATRKEYEASIFGGYTFSPKFRINASSGYTYNVYGQAEKRLLAYRDGGTFYTAFNYNYLPTKLFTVDGNFRFSSFADPQGRARSNLSSNIGAQYKMLNRRLIVGISVTDPLTTQKLVTTTYGANFLLINNNATQTKNYKLTLSYQLNKNIAPPKSKTKNINKDQLQKLFKSS